MVLVVCSSANRHPLSMTIVMWTDGVGRITCKKKATTYEVVALVMFTLFTREQALLKRVSFFIHFYDVKAQGF